MNRNLPFVAAFVIGLLVVAAMSMFTVDQRTFVLVRQFGEIKSVISEPGLYFKWPLIQDVRSFDKRIQTYDAPEPASFFTSEKKTVQVDAFVKWRVIDPKQYYISVQGDEAVAQTRLSQKVNAGLRDEFSKRTVHEVVSGEREKIMDAVRTKADADVRSIGVEIVDVRLKRVDLPDKVSESVYSRMESERKRVANELRSLGGAESEKIRADADRQREVILADAYKAAQKTKGEGDAKASAIYAGAYGQNPEFYSFYRSLEAYKSTFKNKSDVMVLDPSSDFFQYLKQSGGSRAVPRRPSK